MKEIPFQHNGQEYLVRIVFNAEESTYNIKAFKDGNPANGYGYSVTQETAFDLFHTIGYNALREQVHAAMDDVVTGKWERYLFDIQTFQNQMQKGGVV